MIVEMAGKPRNKEEWVEEPIPPDSDRKALYAALYAAMLADPDREYLSFGGQVVFVLYAPSGEAKDYVRYYRGAP